MGQRRCDFKHTLEVQLTRQSDWFLGWSSELGFLILPSRKGFGLLETSWGKRIEKQIKLQSYDPIVVVTKQLPGNSLFVTPLECLSDPTRVVGDLQQSGIKRSRRESPTTFVAENSHCCSSRLKWNYQLRSVPMNWRWPRPWKFLPRTQAICRAVRRVLAFWQPQKTTGGWQTKGGENSLGQLANFDTFGGFTYFVGRRKAIGWVRRVIWSPGQILATKPPCWEFTQMDPNGGFWNPQKKTPETLQVQELYNGWVDDGGRVFFS